MIEDRMHAHEHTVNANTFTKLVRDSFPQRSEDWLIGAILNAVKGWLQRLKKAVKLI